ncbi:MAG TPA: adenylate/guanylate cyclase domain-containing protein [Solirubrobacterales bacterium]|nr:adenylate/guanylate cyclase domain-containing protein [Solirubrobacterales bacterium]
MNGRHPFTRPHAAIAIGALLLPLAGLALLLAAPELDVRWEHHPSHFWLVLAAGTINAALAYATGSAARRHGDARVFLVSLGFLAAAGFLGLHALATPGVLLEESNTGFVIATPIGLAVAAVLTAASSLDLGVATATRLMSHARLAQNGLIGLMVVWAAASLAGAPPLDDPSAPERASGALLVPTVAAVGLYAFAVARYLGIYRRNPSGMLLWMAAAFALLAEAMIAVALGRNWHATWWEWHLLMLLAFSLVAWSAHRQWHEERFSGLYLSETASGRREITVLFADLEGFTSFAERNDPDEVSAMLNEFFEVAIPPVVEQHGGEIDRIVGDALMVTFNTRGDQADHAVRAARAGLAIQAAAAEIAVRRPDWPRFRVGINSGEVVLSVLGTKGGRTRTVVGDAVNTAARIEANAPVGGVAVGADTVARLGAARVESLGAVAVKGKAEPVEIYRLIAV